MKLQIGQKIKGECIACCEEEIWEIEKVTDEEYLDGIFTTYHLKAIKNCISNTVKTSIKDCPEIWKQFEIIKNEPPHQN